LQKSLISILAVVLSGCPGAVPPLMETCIIGTVGLECYDERRDRGDREYTQTFEEAINDVCTNAEDFLEQREFYERELRRCQEGDDGRAKTNGK